MPFEHCASLVHQHGIPDAVHVPVGEGTSLQLPVEHDQAVATDVRT
jgi:hypothetical protein